MTMAFTFPLPGLWPQRRRARIDSIDAEADALVRELGAAAYAEARRREHEASSDALAKDWDRVALAIARKLTSDVGAVVSDRMAARVVLVPDRDRASPPAAQIRLAAGPLDERRSSLEARPQRFRIQCAGAPNGHGPSILKEVEVQVPDVSSAIVEAANLVWPRGTVALRILDRDGREVFERHRSERR
jgi:hypothetical protein